MGDVIDKVGITTTRAVLDGKKLYVHQKFDDDAALAKNKRLRGSEILDKAKLGLHEDEDIRFAISCPSVEQWAVFKRKYPDIYKGLHDKDESQRMAAARRLALIKPAWVVQARF